MSSFDRYLALGVIPDGSYDFTELPALGMAETYARQPIIMLPVGGGRVINTAEIVFPAVTLRAWPMFNAFAIFDKLTDGNMVMAWRTKSPEFNDLAVGKRIRVGKSSVQLTFPIVTSNFGSEVMMGGPYSVSAQQIFWTPAQMVLSQAEYDAIPTKDADTIYIYSEA